MMVYASLRYYNPSLGQIWKTQQLGYKLAYAGLFQPQILFNNIVPNIPLLK